MDPKSLQIRLRANHMMITNVGFLRTEDCRRLIDSKIVLYYIYIIYIFLKFQEMFVLPRQKGMQCFRNLK